MTDLNKLKAKIAGKLIPKPDMELGHVGVGYNIAIREILALLATHAAEPAPVAVEPVAWGETYDDGVTFLTASIDKTGHHTVPLYAHPPRADLAPTGNTWTRPRTAEDAINAMAGDGDADPEGTAKLNYPDLFAPTGNTALVKWWQSQLSKVDDYPAPLFAEKIRETIAAIQPAAPQPTPEVEALSAEDHEMIARVCKAQPKLTMAGAEGAYRHDDVARLLRLIRPAALARGSVDGKGESGDPMDNGPQRIPDYE